MLFITRISLIRILRLRFAKLKQYFKNEPEVEILKDSNLGRQRGRVVRASDLKSVGRRFKSRSDH